MARKQRILVCCALLGIFFSTVMRENPPYLGYDKYKMTPAELMRQLMNEINQALEPVILLEKSFSKSLYYLQPDGTWKKGGDGRSEGKTIAQVREIVHDHWKDEARSFYIVSENGEAYNIGEIFYSSRTAKELVLAGNLHENPELWEKICSS